jgi:hypothetical protein
VIPSLSLFRAHGSVLEDVRRAAISSVATHV